MSILDEDDDAIPGASTGKLPVPDDVQDAIRTLIRWSGDVPEREGLIETPERVARAWKEYCRGYGDDPAYHLSRIFHEVGGYDDVVLLKGIPFQSHCEHHMAPIIGKANRLQVQERLTSEVANCIWEHLKPQGVAVVIEATHGCMTGRGVRTPGVIMKTSRMLGVFRDDEKSREEVLKLISS